MNIRFVIYLILVTRKHIIKALFNDLSIKNDGYAFLIRLELMFSMSLWKDFQLLQILNDLSTRHLIKLILYENDVKLLKFKRSPV